MWHRSMRSSLPHAAHLVDFSRPAGLADFMSRGGGIFVEKGLDLWWFNGSLNGIFHGISMELMVV